MAGIIRTLKRTFVDELLQKSAIPVDQGHARLTMRLKRDRYTQERYIVLGLVGATNYKHAELDADEFHALFEAMRSLQKAMHIPTAVPPLKSGDSGTQFSLTSPQKPKRPPTACILGCGLS